MITRDELITRASKECLQELYSFAQPHVEWQTFLSENKKYSNDYILWVDYDKAFRLKDKFPGKWEFIKKEFPNWENKTITECIGPRPYEFYYLPREIMNDICDSYIHAYKLDSKQELLDTIETLKNYCKEPIVDKYIDDWTDKTGFHHPGYRSYDHPDNLEKEIFKIIDDNIPLYQPPRKLVSDLQEKFFEFLDMAGNFFNWNRDLNSFNISVYMGPSPNSYKEAVIENWKKYRNQDIEINEEQIKKEYYGEELD